MILRNNDLVVNIENIGAELKSIKYNGMEYLWQGNPEYWKRTSPILFPIVGRLLDNEYILNDKVYHMTQHGFARDKEFELVESDETSVLYSLKEDEESLKKYPYKFKLCIGYRLINNKIEVSWKVVNNNEIPMYYQIGAHPAFNFLNGSVLVINKKTNKYEMKATPFVQDVTPEILVNEIEVNNQTFIQDALIFDGIDEIVLKDDIKSVKIECNDFPFIGIWSKVTNGENAPFVCLEPWHGITDCSFHDKHLTSKKGINILEPGKEFNTKYTIELE